jgi:hypothetical protein
VGLRLTQKPVEQAAEMLAAQLAADFASHNLKAFWLAEK